MKPSTNKEAETNQGEINYGRYYKKRRDAFISDNICV